MKRPARITGFLASTRDLALGAAGFVAAIVLIDSGGLSQWAERLDLGPLRTIAVPVTETVDRGLRPLGIDRVRLTALAELGRVSWSDNPAALVAAAPPPAPAKPPPAKPVKLAANVKAAPAPIPPAPKSAAPLLLSPVVAAVPSSTALPPLLPVPPGRPRVVALVGDSMMAVGLSDVLLRQTADNAGLQVIKAFRSGTGLARPDVFDWNAEYPAMIGNARPDLVIVAIGANDAQGYIDAKGKVVSFGSDPWIANYRTRITAFMDMLEGSARQVIWVGLPPMRAALYDAHVATINRIAYTVVSTYPNAAWWNPAPYIGNKDGGFRNLGQVAGYHGRPKIAQLREPDGIHLTDDGALLLTDVLIPWLSPAAAHPLPVTH